MKKIIKLRGRLDIDFLKIAGILLLFFVGTGGLWAINDIVVCLYMTLGSEYQKYCGITNGFSFLDGVKAFHIGLWTAEFCLFMLTLFLLYYVYKNK